MKNNIRVIILTPLLMIVAVFSAFRTVVKSDSIKVTTKEKLSYDIMVINAALLRDYYNGTNSTAGNNGGAANTPEIFDSIIFQHQNPADFQNANQRHEFRLIAYIHTAAGTHLISNSGPVYFFLNDRPHYIRHSEPFGGGEGTSDNFGNYIMTKSSLDVDQLNTANTILLYPEPLPAVDGSNTNYVRYKVIYAPMLMQDSLLNKFIKGLAPLKGDDKKLQEFIYKFNLSEKLNITGSGLYLNPSPPA